MKVRTRYAPSPTGRMHVGNLRTALYAYLIAKHGGGLMPAGELIKMMVIQAVLKTLYEIIILPVTIRVVNYIKKVDGSDVFDEHISYNVLKIKEL